MLVLIVELIEQPRMAAGELIDVLGCATIEAVLVLSAEKVVGYKHQGIKRGEIAWHGSQASGGNIFILGATPTFAQKCLTFTIIFV